MGGQYPLGVEFVVGGGKGRPGCVQCQYGPSDYHGQLAWEQSGRRCAHHAQAEGKGGVMDLWCSKHERAIGHRMDTCDHHDFKGYGITTPLPVCATCMWAVKDVRERDKEE